MRKTHVKVKKNQVNAMCTQGNRADNGGHIVKPNAWAKLPDEERCKKCQPIYEAWKNRVSK